MSGRPNLLEASEAGLTAPDGELMLEACQQSSYVACVFSNRSSAYEPT